MSFLNYMSEYINGLGVRESIELVIGLWLLFGGWKKVIKFFKRVK